jgi:hypothetical protein
MFDSASSDVKPYTRVILREIGLALNKVENRISLSGHTDAQPFAGGDKGFGNWELSTNRANASRREMVAGGMADAKVMRVVGLASTVLYDKQEPLQSEQPPHQHYRHEQAHRGSHPRRWPPDGCRERAGGRSRKASAFPPPRRADKIE